ncbi:MAG: Rid family hydrolase [Minwuia sp.]|nr:Rid family hydrolase [Minwuia sp.]
MHKEVIKHPVLQQMIDKGNVPLSLATRGAGMVFVSGLPPVDLKTGELVRGDIEAQTRASLNAVKAVLGEAGSSLDKVLKCTVFAVNAGQFDRVNAIYAEFFPKDPPARTFVTVGSWPWPFDIEIEAVALT